MLAYGRTTESTQILSNTPGYQLTAISEDSFNINTTNGANYGFTSLYNIQGAYRIRGGGVFEVDFATDMDLTKTFNPALSSVAARYGQNNQFITGTLIQSTPSIPEPSTTVLALAGIWLVAFFRKSKSAPSK